MHDKQWRHTGFLVCDSVQPMTTCSSWALISPLVWKAGLFSLYVLDGYFLNIKRALWFWHNGAPACVGNGHMSRLRDLFVECSWSCLVIQSVCLQRGRPKSENLSAEICTVRSGALTSSSGGHFDSSDGRRWGEQKAEPAFLQQKHTASPTAAHNYPAWLMPLAHPTHTVCHEF